MKLDLPQRQRWLVIGVAVLAAVLILDRIAFTPLTALWQAHTAEIAKLRQQVGDGRNTIARAAQIDRLWTDMQANALPKDPAQAEGEVLTAVARWGAANNIELSSIRPQWKRGTSDRFSLLECRVDAVGTLPTLTRFVYELEHSPMALRVDSIELTSRDDYGQKLSLGLIVSGLRLTPLERKQQ
jgi:hypothetical protein